jgi:hypothetical protein
MSDTKEVSIFWNLLKIGPLDGDYTNNSCIVALNEILLQKQNLMTYGILGNTISTNLDQSNIAFDATNTNVFSLDIATYTFNVSSQNVDVANATVSGTFSQLFLLLTKSFNTLCDSIMTNNPSILTVSMPQPMNEIINNYEKNFIDNFSTFSSVANGLTKYTSF